MRACNASQHLSGSVNQLFSENWFGPKENTEKSDNTIARKLGHLLKVTRTQGLPTGTECTMRYGCVMGVSVCIGVQKHIMCEN